MLKNISTTRNVPIDSLMDTQTEVKIVTLDKDSKNIWVKQTYLAMGNLLNAAAELKYPMEGFVL
jgi:hypothetical protein